MEYGPGKEEVDGHGSDEGGGGVGIRGGGGPEILTLSANVSERVASVASVDGVDSVWSCGLLRGATPKMDAPKSKAAFGLYGSGCGCRVSLFCVEGG